MESSVPVKTDNTVFDVVEALVELQEAKLEDAAAIEAPDFGDVAESFGAEGHTVRSLDDLESIQDRIDSKPDGPVVVDCKVNRNVRHRFYDSAH